MRPSRWMALAVVCLLYATVQAAEVRKLGVGDLWWGTGTWTSPAGKVVTKIPVSTPDDNSFMGVYDVKAFGAVGDGTTNDTAAILTAWGQIEATGGTLFFPAGTYLVSGLDFSKGTVDTTHSWTIKGVGRKDSIIKSTGGVNILLDLGGRDRVFIEDMGFQNTTSALAPDQICIARYRVDGAGGHAHVYRNVYVEGYFTKAILYSVSSEVNEHYGLEFINWGNGAAFASADTDFLVAGGGQAVAAGTTSNTVNNFYGGTLQGSESTTGGAVYFTTGNADNFNFYGVYFVGYTGGYVIKLGTNASDSVQGSKVFDGCRFEGTADAITVTAGQVQRIRVTTSTFGATGGEDVNWTNTTLTDVGALGWYFDSNIHYNQGLIIPVITSSIIRIPATGTSYHGASITINEHIANSYIEADHITLGASVYYYGSVLITNDYNAGTYNIKYGPGSSVTGNNQGSIVTFQPFKAEPAAKATGTIVSADSSAWEPSQTGGSGMFPVFYNGTNWMPLVPRNATPATAAATCYQGTIAFDANYIYVCTSDNTWKRGTIATWP